MNVDHGERATGAAARRRGRRLRGAWRHEWRPLTTVLFGVRDQARTKPLGDRRPPLRQRPGVLTESEPQGGAVTFGNVAAPVPLLAVPLLAGAAGEAVDARTEERKKREEEEELLSRRQCRPSAARTIRSGGSPTSSCTGGQEEKEEEEEEEASSYLFKFLFWPRSSSTAAVGCSFCWFCW